jgi:hypothetical protein
MKCTALALLAAFTVALAPLTRADNGYDHDHDHDHDHDSVRGDSPLVAKVRAATRRFADINVATSEGWVQGTPCVSGPEFGAMGVHFVLPARVQSAVLDARQPQALIYEPLETGAFRLVGVEFIILADTWQTNNPNAGPPALDGNLLNYVGAPNRYGLPAFYELHVWAFEHNPNGSFADWNTRVVCDKQPIPAK